MTDEELAKGLEAEFHREKVVLAGWPHNHWLDVARRARELLTQELITARLLPEEREVLEAAKELFGAEGSFVREGESVRTSYLWESHQRFCTAVRRLRESQSPRPRYTISEARLYGALEYNICDQGVAWASTSSRNFADKVVNALNQQRT